jgi:hypothetical protein
VALSVWGRNLLGCVAVAAGVAAFSLGLPGVDAAIPDSTVPAGRPLEFAQDASVEPPPRARLVADQTSPTEGVLTLLVDGVTYRVSERPFTGTLEELAAQIANDLRNQNGLQAVGALHAAVSDQGVPGVQAAFTGESRSGWFTAFLRGGIALVAVVDGNDASLSRNLHAIDDSVETLRFEAQA